MQCGFFYKKRTLLSTHQSAIREAPTVFSRLPSLMAADKPCPLQPSLVVRSCTVNYKGRISLLSQFFFQDSHFLSELRGEIDSFSQKACLLQMMKFLSVEVVAVVVQQVLSQFTHRFLINDSAYLVPGNFNIVSMLIRVSKFVADHNSLLTQ